VKSLFHAIVAAAVVTAAAAGLSAGSRSLPEGPARDAAERFVAAPGKALLDKLDETGLAKRAAKAEKKAEKEAAKVEDKAGLDDHLASVGVWAAAGLVFCWLTVLIMGISSLKTALALGFKVTLFMIALQGALVATGVFAWHAMKG
jgi:hypothetical protein